VHILPVPYEATVSYEEGTREGPAAIIRASHEVELYDEDFDGEPALTWGIHTLPALKAGWKTPEKMMDDVASAAEAVTRAGKLLLVLGGEHSITPGIVRGVRRARNEAFVVVQIDAHADLRDTFRGTRYSHGCAMRRVLEENPGALVQIGIRSYSAEEAAFISGNRGRISLWSTRLMREEDPAEVLRQVRSTIGGRPVYLTIDVDGLDPSVVPATGTPEPDGLSWTRACEVLEVVAAAGPVVAMDCVELAPRHGLHAAEFTVARLLYKTLSMILQPDSANDRGSAPRGAFHGTPWRRQRDTQATAPGEPTDSWYPA
jgi:agmatinase